MTGDIGREAIPISAMDSQCSIWSGSGPACSQLGLATRLPYRVAVPRSAPTRNRTETGNPVSCFGLHAVPIGPETLPLLTEAAYAPEDGQGRPLLRWCQVFPDKIKAESKATQLGEVYAGIAAGVTLRSDQLSLNATDGFVGNCVEMSHFVTRVQAPRVAAIVKCKPCSTSYDFAYIGVHALEFV